MFVQRHFPITGANRSAAAEGSGMAEMVRKHYPNCLPRPPTYFCLHLWGRSAGARHALQTPLCFSPCLPAAAGMSHSNACAATSSGGSSWISGPGEQGSRRVRFGHGVSGQAVGSRAPVHPCRACAGGCHCTQVGSIFASIPRARPLQGPLQAPNHILACRAIPL